MNILLGIFLVVLGLLVGVLGVVWKTPGAIVLTIVGLGFIAWGVWLFFQKANIIK